MLHEKHKNFEIDFACASTNEMNTDIPYWNIIDQL